MFSRVLSTVVVGGVAVFCVVVIWPQFFGLERSMGVAQAVAFRGLAIAIAAVGVVILLLISLVSRTLRRFSSTLAVVLVAFCLAGVAVLGVRGLGNDALETKRSADLTVVEWNTLGGAPHSAVIAKLAIDSDADIVSLPETTEVVAREVAREMRAAGHPMTVHTIAFNHIAPAKSTSVLISPDLGGYHLDTGMGSTSTVPTLVLRSDTGTGPVIVGVHVVSPLPSELSRWRSDLDFVKRTCGGSNVILVGDFNATLDHFSGLGSTPNETIGNCSDAAAASKNGAVGTWPTGLPALLGTPIDHVLTTSNWRVTGMLVVHGLDRAGSDHRPIVVQLHPKG